MEFLRHATVLKTKKKKKQKLNYRGISIRLTYYVRQTLLRQALVKNFELNI